MTILDFILLIILILNILFGYYLFVGWFSKTPFYPSSTKKLNAIFDDLDINPKGKKFIDLGSGDGRFVVWAAKKGFDAYGIEINPFLTLISRFRIFLKRRKNAHIERKDFKTIDYSKYDVVYFYIYSEHMEKVREKLYKELKPGSIIISNVFKFKDIEANRKIGNYLIYKIS